MIPEHLTGGTTKFLCLVGIVLIFQLILFPRPGEMADFMIGCSKGNFRPSATCEAVCLLLHNRTACCYGVNYDSRAVCACCNYAINTGGSHQQHNKMCPTVCSANCHIITLNAGNCSELRGTKHRSGGGPSIINDLSILSDVPSGHWGKGGPLTPRTDLESEEKVSTSSAKNTTSSSSSSQSSSVPAPLKHRNVLSSTTNKLFSRLTSSMDF